MAKNELVCLGLIYTTPCYPYIIDEVVKKLQLDQWGYFSRSSIYNTLGKLEKDAYVNIQLEKVGNMPDRKVFSITEKGKERLLDELIKSIYDLSPKENMFYMAVGFYFNLDKALAEEHLNKRLELIRKRKSYLQNCLKDAMESGLLHAVVQCKAGLKHADVEAEMIHDILKIYEVNPAYFSEQLMTMYQNIIQEINNRRS